MEQLEEVRVGMIPLERFAEVLSAKQLEAARENAQVFANRFAKRVIWNVNSTAVGGGVAEMLPSLLAYTRSVGIDTRWLVISGEPAFFAVTKRLHHALHGSEGDGSPLDDAAREVYERVVRRNAQELASFVKPEDAIVLHDPQTAGMAPWLRETGAKLLWRCHIGSDTSNEQVELGWSFLAPYLAEFPAYVFSRSSYVPESCDHGKSEIITPSIDAFTTKNREMNEAAIHTILVHTGIVEGPPPPEADHGFVRSDGTPGRVERRADIVRAGRPPRWDTPLIVQISRWDPLKDMLGVLEGFALLCERSRAKDPPHLLLAGPDVKAVTDDPEGLASLEEVVEAWRALPLSVRDRVHLASLPGVDVDENAAIVNAIQRHATIIVQKSLREGFGLTVTEAMWKERPVVASAVGGINDQIEDGQSGVLLKDPRDLDTFAEILEGLLESPERRRLLGVAAKERVRERFLGLDHLLKYAKLLTRLDES